MHVAYYRVETSAPANAKSQSCFEHREGRPEKQPVKYSTQFGPPAEVEIYRRESDEVGFCK